MFMIPLKKKVIIYSTAPRNSTSINGSCDTTSDTVTYTMNCKLTTFDIHKN